MNIYKPRIMITGFPNSGKSYLINALVGADVAVESRETIEIVNPYIVYDSKEYLLVEGLTVENLSKFNPLLLLVCCNINDDFNKEQLEVLYEYRRIIGHNKMVKSRIVVILTQVNILMETNLDEAESIIYTKMEDISKIMNISKNHIILSGIKGDNEWQKAFKLKIDNIVQKQISKIGLYTTLEDYRANRRQYKRFLLYTITPIAVILVALFIICLI